MDKKYDIVVYGNYTHDLLISQGKESERLGGSSAYISELLRVLGTDYHVVAKAGNDFKYHDHVHKKPIVVERPTTFFVNTYMGADRTQQVRAVCDPIMPQDVVDARVAVITGTIGDVRPETIREIRNRSEVLLCDVQSMVRRIDEHGNVYPVKLEESGYMDVMGLIDYVIMSDKETAFADARKLGQKVVITKDKYGCTIVQGDKSNSVSTEPVEPVDPTGAGDMFVGGFAYALLKGRDMVECAKFANKCGALALREVGVPHIQQEWISETFWKEKPIKVAITGVGNCCSSLIQGLFYYKNVSSNDVTAPGLMHNVIGGYRISDIKPVAAFDIDARKVGKDLSEAIFQKPNCTLVFQKEIPNMGVTVQMGHVMDGVAPHMSEFHEDETFIVADREPADVVKVLKESGAEILINYLPVGSEEAVRFYAQCALEAGIAMVNCMPVFIASDPEWANKFREKGLPIVGDDIKAQIGATITHRTLARLFAERGVKIERTYQLNTGGNTDFLNMVERARLKSKKISKTEAVQSILPERLEPQNIHVGPSDYVSWQNDNKVCFLRIEGKKFGGAPVNIEARLSVEDSPNSAGCAIDAIRCAKLALDRGISGPITSISSYVMKHPPEQYPDNTAREYTEAFIRGDRER